jgi:hypothetical protein
MGGERYRAHPRRCDFCHTRFLLSVQLYAQMTGHNISFPTHAAAELFLGLVTMVAPPLLGAGDVGVVAGVVLGAVLIGLALTGIGAVDRNEERPALPVALHYLIDRGSGLVMLAVAILLALSGDDIAAVTFAAVALADVALWWRTRYVVAT